MCVCVCVRVCVCVCVFVSLTNPLSLSLSLSLQMGGIGLGGGKARHSSMIVMDQGARPGAQARHGSNFTTMSSNLCSPGSPGGRAVVRRPSTWGGGISPGGGGSSPSKQLARKQVRVFVMCECKPAPSSADFLH